MIAGVIFEFAKGGEVVRLSVDTFNGRSFASFRVWYRDGDTLKPTCKGVTIPLVGLGDLLAA